MTAPAHPLVDGLRSTLYAVRKELLDLGLRNPLLNYRLLKARGVEVVDERPADIYRLLVGEGRPFSFLPGDEGHQAVDDDAEEIHFEPPANDLGAHFTDTFLQTALPAKQLQYRLLATFYAA